jgi:hypothetical protein
MRGLGAVGRVDLAKAKSGCARAAACQKPVDDFYERNPAGA